MSRLLLAGKAEARPPADRPLVALEVLLPVGRVAEEVAAEQEAALARASNISSS